MWRLKPLVAPQTPPQPMPDAGRPDPGGMARVWLAWRGVGVRQRSRHGRWPHAGVVGLAVVLAAFTPSPARTQVVQAAPPATPRAAPLGGFDEPLFAGVALVHDNDNLPHPGNTLRDDNYSAAYELRVNGRAVERAGLTRPLDAIDWLTGVRRLHARGGRRYHSARLIGLVYTPDRIDTAEVQRDDRPYASLVAVSVSRTSVGGASLDRLWWSELSVGLLGAALVGDAQRLIHRTRRWMTGKDIPVDPLGWPNQISAGGEPTALYGAGYQRQLAADGAAGRRRHWQVVSAVAGSVGYRTAASASISARAGAFTSEFWEFSRGVASPSVGQQAAHAGVPRWDLFGFAQLGPRLVAYDAILQGQFRHSVHTVRPRRLLGEWEGGIGASVPLWAFQLQIVVQFAQGRTADFVGPKARNYTWGTVGLLLSRPGARRARRQGRMARAAALRPSVRRRLRVRDARRPQSAGAP